MLIAPLGRCVKARPQRWADSSRCGGSACWFTVGVVVSAWQSPPMHRTGTCILSPQDSMQTCPLSESIGESSSWHVRRHRACLTTTTLPCFSAFPARRNRASVSSLVQASSMARRLKHRPRQEYKAAKRGPLLTCPSPIVLHHACDTPGKAISFGEHGAHRRRCDCVYRGGADHARRPVVLPPMAGESSLVTTLLPHFLLALPEYDALHPPRLRERR